MTDHPSAGGAQDEALRLADWLEAVGGGPRARGAAAELRRLHARVQTLEDAWSRALAHTDSVERAVEAEREACAQVCERDRWADDRGHYVSHECAHAIRARGAKGESNAE